MSTIAILRTTGNSQVDRVTAGVYGAFEPAALAQPGTGVEVATGLEQPRGVFRVAPEFPRISPLFDQVGSQLPGTHDQVVELEVPDGTEDLVKAAILRALAVRWGDAYRSVFPTGNPVAAAMVEGERTAVLNRTKQVIEDMGMRAWYVPVTAVMSTDYAGSYYQDEAQLMAGLRNPRDFAVEQYAEVEQAPAELLLQTLAAYESDQARAAQAAAAATPPEPPRPQVISLLPTTTTPTSAPGTAVAATPAWRGAQFAHGVDATVSGRVVALARTPEEAQMAATLSIAMAQRLGDGAVEFRPAHLMETAPSPAPTFEEVDHDIGDGSGSYGSSDYERPRASF